MERHHRQASGLACRLGVAATLAIAAWSAQGATTEWRFHVMLGDNHIGEHRFRLEQLPDNRRLHSEARMTVRFLGFNAFTCTHEAIERWRGDCLEGIESKTDRNGHPYAVSGTRIDQVFQVRTLKDTSSLPACVMSFAYWNPKILDQRQLLNPQTGEYVDVTIESKGMETVATGNRTTDARRYSLTGRKLRIDLWYTLDGRWIGLESLTDGGRRLRYVLI